MDYLFQLWLGHLILSAWVWLFLLPSMVALYRRRVGPGATIVVNLLTGWTGIGWVVAMAMACGGRREVAA